MARSEIVVTEIARGGTAPIGATTANSTDDHYFVNTGREYLEIVSTDAGAQTVEIVVNPSYSADGLVVSNLSIAVPAGATRLAGPFRIQTFKQNASNHVYVNPSVSTTLTLRAWRLPAASNG